MVKNPKATDANENCEVKMTLLPKFEPATVHITWGQSVCLAHGWYSASDI
jgi:hypothetical protein